MVWRVFRLNEIHLRIDEALRAEMRRRFSNPIRILRLTQLKLSIRQRLATLALKPQRI